MRLLFVSVVVISLLIVGYLWGPALISYGFYIYGVNQVHTNLSKAEGYIARAHRIFAADLYSRALIEIVLFKLNQTQDQTEIVNLSNQAITLATEALHFQPQDYRNWWVGARLYQALALRGVERAAEHSAELYAGACQLVTTHESEAQALLDVCYAKLTPAN